MKQQLRPGGLKKRKKEQFPGEWAQQLDGNAICSYPPEDFVIENYGRFLKQKAKSILSEERERVEPFTTSVLDGIRRGRVLAAPPGGNSMVSVDDVVSGLMLAMERGQAGRRYILSAERMTYRELLDRMAALVGTRPVRWTLPVALERPLVAAATLVSAAAPGVPGTPKEMAEMEPPNSPPL